jgi:hypothetical protein
MPDKRHIAISPPEWDRGVAVRPCTANSEVETAITHQVVDLAPILLESGPHWSQPVGGRGQPHRRSPGRRLA